MSNSVASNSNKITELIVYNPYRLSVQLEVKCDYQNKTKKFRYHKFVEVPGRKNTIIKTPANLKQCQIWPKITW